MPRQPRLPGSRHGRQGIPHGVHGVCQTIKCLALILARILSPLAFPLLPRPQRFRVIDVDIAAVPGVAHGIDHPTGKHGDPLGHGRSAAPQLVEKAGLFLLGLGLLAAELRKVPTFKIHKKVLIIGVSRPIGLLSGHIRSLWDLYSDNGKEKGRL